MVLRPRVVPAVRLFSSSASAHGLISNIGRQPIRFPPTVTLTPTPTAVDVTGPLGTTSVPTMPYMRFTFPAPDTLSVAVEDGSEKKQRQMWGTTRTLIANAIEGMTSGFSVMLYLVGVGYRAALEPDPRGPGEGRSGQRIAMKVGFSHSVYVSVPPNIKAEVPAPTKISLYCTDKQLLGKFAAQVKRWRPPEPYKGKGIYVGTERVRLKTMKKK
ncbi:Putative 54S ribosomal protein L6 [Sparassis crispa]|uniref:54S ribosomal protein L6 n=1 Tax=Sparassis crispa TaxID=139825 RepID=A0A401GT48_9APHY|nr:Putative 54S ribosomal protein L6 [Sparassis crispa]GBE84914.1 Putative 54S ribosomal protein L6 [Sparassis crispa]